MGFNISMNLSFFWNESVSVFSFYIDELAGIFGYEDKITVM